MLALTATVGLVGCGSDNEAITQAPDAALEKNDCFWVGPYIREKEETNFAYPDTGAAYWHAGYTLPVGASLKLLGEYPYARYMSLNSYRTDASPAYAIADSSIAPNQGGINPFVQGNIRNSEFRSYQVSVLQGDAPDVVADNTLYDSVNAGEQTVLLYRVYVPNAGQDLKGGVNLPTVELTLQSGEVVSGEKACEALESDTQLVEIPVIPTQTYGFLRQNNPAINSLVEDGLSQSVKWRAAYNAQYANKCAFLNQCEETPERQVNWYANIDNQYATAFIDNSIKPVVVIRGQLPVTPLTLDGEIAFDESQAQLRYWSICQNEYYSQKVTACLYDEQLNIQPDGKYLIVTSTLDNQPSNANSECGIDFLPWSEQGDGFALAQGMQNNVHDGLLIVRNMLPTNGFSQALQNTQTPGDEEAVMGDYLPTAEYFTKQEFESLGCEAYLNL